MPLYSVKPAGPRSRLQVVNKYEPQGHAPMFRSCSATTVRNSLCLGLLCQSLCKNRAGSGGVQSQAVRGLPLLHDGLPPLRASLRLQQCVESAGVQVYHVRPAPQGRAVARLCRGLPQEALIFGRRSDLHKAGPPPHHGQPRHVRGHIYGEREMGGTNWLYLSPVPHAELGQPDVPAVSAPELTRGMLGSIAVIAGVWPVILGGAYSMSKHYKNGGSGLPRGAQQANGQGCADSHDDVCGSEPADHNPEKGQGGGQC